MDVILLTPVNAGTVPSGDPVSIYLASQSVPSIGVKESGSIETAKLIFEVQDSAGVPVDLDHSVNVNFRLGASPGGGALLSPAIVTTNNFGQAEVNLTSGTKAGVVQIIATINLGSKKIISKPVSISIHGGLPDEAHFSIAPQLLNFPGYDISGLQDGMTAYVGDKYANPVKEKTSIYFTSTGGIIEGSALTNEIGIGSVNLISADPRPSDPLLGKGFAKVTATTSDENYNQISSSVYVLFSGTPQVSVTPTSFSIPNGGAQQFNYVVSDQNGNPLSSGTNISVSVQGENVGAQGDLSVQLPDTQSRGWTQFSFTVYDTADTLDVIKPVSIKISSDGPNGGSNLVISGTGR